MGFGLVFLNKKSRFINTELSGSVRFSFQIKNYKIQTELNLRHFRNFARTYIYIQFKHLRFAPLSLSHFQLQHNRLPTTQTLTHICLCSFSLLLTFRFISFLTPSIASQSGNRFVFIRDQLVQFFFFVFYFI